MTRSAEVGRETRSLRHVAETPAVGQPSRGPAEQLDAARLRGQQAQHTDGGNQQSANSDDHEIPPESGCCPASSATSLARLARQVNLYTWYRFALFTVLGLIEAVN